MPAVIPIAAAGISAYGSYKSAKGASKLSPVEQQAQGQQAQAGKDLASQGGSLFRRGMPAVDQGLNTLQTLAGGSRGAQQQTLAPDVEAINQTYGGTRRTLSRFLRGPDRDFHLGELERERASGVASLFRSNKSNATARLLEYGDRLTGAGSQATAASAGVGANLQQGAFNARSYGNNVQQQAGADTAGLIFELLKNYSFKGESSPGEGLMFFSGFAGEFGRRLKDERATNAAKAERDADRENRLLSHLATSDDPEIASMALTGMMDQSAGRPRKGLRGFLGEMEGHPALPTIRQLIQRGQYAPAEPGSAVQPGTAAVEPGARPIPPMPPGVSPDVAGAPPSRGFAPQEPPALASRQAAPTSTHARALEPRRIFLSPAERARQEEEAKLTGRLSAFRTGMGNAKSPEEQDIVRGLAGSPRRQTQGKPVNVEVSDGAGGSYTTAASYDPMTKTFEGPDGTPLTGVTRIIPNTQPRQPTLRGVKVQDRESPTGWSMAYSNPDGTEAYRVAGATPYTPPPAFGSTVTIEDPEGNATVAGVPRGGGPPVALGSRPAPASVKSPEQQLAEGVVAAINTAIKDQSLPNVPVQQGLRDRLVGVYNQKYGRKWTYDQWVAQAGGNATVAGRMGGPPPPPKRGGAAPPKPTGGTDPTNPLGLKRPGQ